MTTTNVTITETPVTVTLSTTGPQGATGEGVPAGGTAGQYLRKSSATDYDTAFDTVTSSDVDGLDAQLAGKAPSSCLYLSGTSGNYVSAPDAAGFDFLGDLTLIARVAPGDWTPAAAMMILARNVGDPNRIWRFSIQTTGSLQLDWFPLGTNASIISKASTAATGFTDGDAKWVAVTLDVDNGAAGNDVRFFTAADSATVPTSWTQLGSTITTAGVTTLVAGAAAIEVGGNFSGAASTYTGKVYRALVASGIGGSGVPGGSTIAEWRGDFPAARFRDTVGNVWTVNGTANGWMVAG